jgi:purine-cytosine permease-like protein
MTKALCLAIAAVGVVLLVYGLNANNSFASSVSNSVTGKPTDKAIWLIALGIIGIVLGGGGLLLGRRNP